LNGDYQKIREFIPELRTLFMDEKRRSHSVEKGEKDYVTDVDLAVQKTVISTLREWYPETGFLAEEGDHDKIDPDQDLWILDPVDGTSNLMHDFRHSAVSLGLWKDGQVVFGLIYNPFSDELFWAEKGKGAWCNDHRIRVSGETEMKRSLILFGTCPYHRERSAEDFRLFEKVFLQSQDVRRLGSAALDLAYIAAGRSEAYFERDLKPWDYAAGLLIVEEAGGTVTDYRGNRPSGLLQFRYHRGKRHGRRNSL